MSQFIARYGKYLVGLIVAGVCLVSAGFLPQHSDKLVSASGTIAAISLVFMFLDQ